MVEKIEVDVTEDFIVPADVEAAAEVTSHVTAAESAALYETWKAYDAGDRVVRFEHGGVQFEVVAEEPSWGNPGLAVVYFLKG